MSKEDARKHKRTPLVVTVDWQVIGSDDVIWSMTGDISYGGLKVKTMAPPSQGAEVFVVFAHQGDGAEPFRIPARVVWVRMDEEFCGMGLAFEPVTDESRQRIERLLDQVKARAESKT